MHLSNFECTPIWAHIFSSSKFSGSASARQCNPSAVMALIMLMLTYRWWACKVIAETAGTQHNNNRRLMMLSQSVTGQWPGTHTGKLTRFASWLNQRRRLGFNYHATGECCAVHYHTTTTNTTRLTASSAAASLHHLGARKNGWIDGWRAHRHRGRQ